MDTFPLISITKSLYDQDSIFFREVAFVKTEEGYQVIDGRKVESVEGYDNLDELMKRSISPEGKLVYYPVLLKDNDPSIRLDLASPKAATKH